ncbi:MAG TPA: S9 family peptidase [Longimicrobiales bacterium]|nr:S9 family peptidase [Longimicrobiales bacterium]
MPIRMVRNASSLTFWAFALLLAAEASGQQSPTGDPGLPPGPGFRDVLSVESVWEPLVSPDGTHVLFGRSIPDWDENRPRIELWIARGDDAPARLLTEADGYSGSAQWTPDGEIAFRDGNAESPTLVVMDVKGDVRRRVPLMAPDPSTVRFSPDGARIALIAREPLSERNRIEQELYGPFTVRDGPPRPTHLWIQAGDGSGEARRLTEGDVFAFDLSWSPDGSEIAFAHQRDGGRNGWWTADISVVDVASGVVRPLVTEAGPDTDPMWSPDGRSVAFLSTGGDSITNLPTELTVVPREGGAMRVLTESLPTEPTPVAWTDGGILLTALEGTRNRLFRVDPTTGALTRLSEDPYLMGSVSVSADGGTIAFSAGTTDRLTEIHRSPVEPFRPEPLTDVTRQVADWDLGTREVVDWVGPGGVRIEGVLHKPSDFDPDRRYPLLVVVHGGPRAVSTPELTMWSVYPVLQFVRKGALVLEPNYRGSTGYGGAFRQLHGRGLGWGDAGDVEAGVADLVRRGFVDADRVGVMGWSYGGFISAYLTAQSRAFRAVSVGAGITDWRTHYAWEPSSWTTRFYSFDATPWEDPNAYAVASPITYVNNASTPTLIQHVDGDPVVTVLNAYELQHALQDLGVQNRMVVYPGDSHGIRPLRQRLAATWHNWQWFLRHLWNEEVELPLEW